MCKNLKRNICINSFEYEDSRSPSPSKLDDAFENSSEARHNSSSLKCNTNLLKLNEPKSHIKLLDSIPNVSIPGSPAPSSLSPGQDNGEKTPTKVN